MAAVLHGRVVSIMVFSIVEGRITGLDVLADPKRLGHLGVAGLRGRE